MLLRFGILCPPKTIKIQLPKVLHIYNTLTKFTKNEFDTLSTYLAVNNDMIEQNYELHSSAALTERKRTIEPEIFVLIFGCVRKLHFWSHEIF